MTTQTPPLTTVDRIRSMMVRHEMNQPQMERMLGVSHGTLGNWLTGTRNPNQVVKKFLTVLETAEVFHGLLFQALLLEARGGK